MTTSIISVGGRTLRLLRHKDGWRIRSRLKGAEIDVTFPACSLAAARRQALERFASQRVVRRGEPTLEDLVEVYKAMPKRVSANAAYINECRLRSVVRAVHSKELDRVLVREVGPDLWSRFMALKQDGSLDLSTRRPGNAAINSAIRCASSMFLRRLRPSYASQGIAVRDDATDIVWLPEPTSTPKAAVDDENMLKAWRKLNKHDPVFIAVGLARFAGLRQGEIEHATHEWLVEQDGAMFIELRDRPEQNWFSKTGRAYRARILSEHLGDALREAQGYLVTTPPGMTRAWWFDRFPQRWVKKYTQAHKPLHRLRGIYADEIKMLTEDAVTAHLAGVRAASESLGHTSTSTTIRHYLSHALR